MSDCEVVDVDLSRFSHGKSPSRWRPLGLFLGVFGWIFFLVVVAGLGAGGLAIALGLLSIGITVIVFILTAVQRTRQSTIGRLAGPVRPGLENESLAPFDRPLGQIVATVDRAAAESAPTKVIRPDPPPKEGRAKSVAYVVAGAAVFVVGLTVLIAVRAGGALLSVSVFLLVVAMIQLFTRGRRVLQPKADAVLANDPRPPVLFLRSFRDDKTAAPARIRLGPVALWGGLRLEESLGFTVGKVGPFLAVGEPNEGLPQLGAARAYLSEGEWQKQVQAWIAEARLIVMLAGPTPWIQWEMENVIRSGRLHRLVLVLPPGRAAPGSKVALGRQQRWANVLNALAGTPQGAALKAVDIATVLMVQFRPDGRILVFRSTSDLVQDYDLAITLALYALTNDGENEAAPSSASHAVTAETTAMPVAALPAPAPRATSGRTAASTYRLGTPSVAAVIGLTLAFVATGLFAGIIAAMSFGAIPWPYGLGRFLLPAVLAGVAIFAAAKLVVKLEDREALLLAGLAAAALLLGDGLILAVARQRSIGSAMLLSLIKGLEPVAAILLAARSFVAFREARVWLPVLVVNAAAIFLMLMLWGGNLVSAFYILGIALVAGSIGYALAMDEN